MDFRFIFRKLPQKDQRQETKGKLHLFNSILVKDILISWKLLSQFPQENHRPIPWTYGLFTLPGNGTEADTENGNGTIGNNGS